MPADYDIKEVVPVELLACVTLNLASRPQDQRDSSDKLLLACMVNY